MFCGFHCRMCRSCCRRGKFSSPAGGFGLRFWAQVPKCTAQNAPPGAGKCIVVSPPSSLPPYWRPPSPKRRRRSNIRCVSEARSACRAHRRRGEHGGWCSPASSGYGRRRAHGFVGGDQHVSCGCASAKPRERVSSQKPAGSVGRVRYHLPAPEPPAPVVNVAQSVELLVVVQAVEGSSPSVHPPGNRGTLRVWRNWQTR